MENIITHLKQRGFISQLTSDEIVEKANRPLKVYIGFDPTAESLHLGNLVGIIALKWFQRFGHTPVALVGGATGMVGDPSGKSVERNLLDETTLRKNLQGIEKVLRQILDFDSIDNRAHLLNNYDWFCRFSFLDFLRDIGKHFRVNTMLMKESVKLRLASEEGISFTEFSYQLLQAYDFLHLFDVENIQVQMGGNDQWGNITAGCELVRKVRGESAFGITFPLLVRSDGKKFGKSEEGAIWLSSSMLSPYDFYQYLFRMPDADIPKMMRMLTFMDLSEIESIESEMKKSTYHPNTAQRRLAEEVTRIVHGEEGVKMAQRVTEAAKPGEKTELDQKTLELLSLETPSLLISFEEVVGADIADLLVKAELSSSKSEARRQISGGGAYLNNGKIEDVHHRIKAEELINARYLLLAIGKKKKRIIQVSYP